MKAASTSCLTFKIYCCVCLIWLVNYSEALRCRSGNQQSDDQVHSVMQKCRKKFASNGNKNNDYMTSSENDSSDDDSTSSTSGEEEYFFATSNKKSGSNHSRNSGNYDHRSNSNYGENERNSGWNRGSYSNGMSNPTNYSWTNGHGNNRMTNENENRGNRNDIQNRDRNNEERQQHPECVTQCFFDELNMVDRRGFPNRRSVIEVMTRGIQDPSVRDFIEESISECFHHLEGDMKNREKCSFAKNLLSCFTDKGRERCDDWDDQ